MWPTHVRHDSSELAESINGYILPGSPKHSTKTEHVSNRDPQHCSPLTKGNHCHYLPCLDSKEAKTPVVQIPDNKFCCSRTSVVSVPQFPHLPQSIWQCNPSLQVLYTDLVLALAEWNNHERTATSKTQKEQRLKGYYRKALSIPISANHNKLLCHKPTKLPLCQLQGHNHKLLLVHAQTAALSYN